jgi:uncharacterized protein involved in exopolysaccharide biosynthesis
MEETRKTREIDVIGMVMKLIPEWKFIAKVVMVTAVIGVIVAINTPKEYTTNVILAPEMTSGGLGLSENLADMAASFGIELNSKAQMDALYPGIYPEIFASTDFIISLFNVPVCQKEDTIKKSYHDHLLVDEKVPFWKYPLVLINYIFKKKESSNTAFDPFCLSKNDEALCEMIRGLITCQVDKKTNVITICVTDIDAKISAVMADTLLHRLQNYITDYRTSKARNDLAYYEKLREECKKEYHDIQREYAAYADSHKSNIFQSSSVKEEELENDMQIRYQAYAQIEQQIRTAKARVQEKTPAFTIIQNATIPNKASSTPRSLIVLLWMFLGTVGASLWVLFGKKIK